MGRFTDFLAGLFRRTRVAPTQTAGVGGARVTGGYVDDGEKNPELVGTRKYITYSEMLANEPTIATGVRLFLEASSEPDFKFEAADNTAAAEQDAEFASSLFDDTTTPFRDVRQRTAGFVFQGYSLQEWTAKRLDDGAFGILEIGTRPQSTIERWDLDEKCRVRGVEQRSPQTFEELYIPRNKLIYAVDSSLSDSPEGLGLFRHMVEPYKRLERYKQIEGTGFETDLRGVPVGYAPLGELGPEEEAKARAQFLADFLQNHIKSPDQGIMLPSDVYYSEGDNPSPSAVRKWAIDTLRGQGGPHAEIAGAILRTMHELARLLGAMGVMLGSGPNGTRSLGESHEKTLARRIDAVNAKIAWVYERDILEPIWRINGKDKATMPRIKPDKVQHSSLTELVSFVEGVARAGLVLTRNDEAAGELFDRAGLSRPQPDDEDMSLLGKQPGDDEEIELDDDDIEEVDPQEQQQEDA